MGLLDQLDLPDQQGHKDQRGLMAPMVLPDLQDQRVLQDQQDLRGLRDLLGQPDQLVLLLALAVLVLRRDL